MPAVLVVEVIFFSPFKRFETKTEKSGRLFFPVKSKEENALLFSVFCLRRLKRAGTAAAAGIKGEREPFRLTGSALRPAACPWASNGASGFYGFCQNLL